MTKRIIEKKELISMGMLMFLFGASNSAAMNNTSLVAAGGTRLDRANNGAVGTMDVRSAADNRTVTRIPSRRYGHSFELTGANHDDAIIAIDEGYISRGNFRRERTVEQTCHCDRTFLSLESAGRNGSYAVYSLSADIDELGRILLSDYYIDRSMILPHQTRWADAQYDDENMRRVGTLVTYVMDRDNIEREVSRAPNSSQPYEFHTEHDGRYEDNPNGGDNVRIYVRPDGEQLRRNWKGTVLVEKPPKPAPVSAPAPQSGQSHQRSGRTVGDVVRNIVTLGGLFG